MFHSSIVHSLAKEEGASVDSRWLLLLEFSSFQVSVKNVSVGLATEVERRQRSPPHHHSAKSGTPVSCQIYWKWISAIPAQNRGRPHVRCTKNGGLGSFHLEHTRHPEWEISKDRILSDIFSSSPPRAAKWACSQACYKLGSKMCTALIAQIAKSDACNLQQFKLFGGCGGVV